MKKVVFVTPTYKEPHEAFLLAMKGAEAAVREAGWDLGFVFEVGCPYISSARATLTRKALDAKADVIVYLDHDVSFRPEDLVRLLETKGPVVGGTYRFKKEPEEYMGYLVPDKRKRPIIREDGCLAAGLLPAGFLKVTRDAIRHFMKSYPDLLFGDPENYSVDIFNHGAVDGTWWGEDYAFCMRWRRCGGELWCIPDLDITHHTAEQAFPGNFHRFLLREDDGYSAEQKQGMLRAA